MRTCALICGLMMVVGCAPRLTDGPGAQVPAGNPRANATATVVPRPAVNAEPLLKVLLQEGPQVSFTLLSQATLANGVTLTAGTYRAEVKQGGIFLANRDLGSGPVRLTQAPGPRFRARIDQDKAPPRRFAGVLTLTMVANRIHLIEEIGLESYLAGVITLEMSPTYPAAALQAQAIAARSYTAARWQTRHDQPFHVHGHFTRDMAYAGLDAPQRAISEAAVKATRGQILFAPQGAEPGAGAEAVLAFFHASSGGQTATPIVLTSQAVPGGHTMTSVVDTASVRAAAAMKLTNSHQDWSARLTWTSLDADLSAWALTQPGRPELGQLVNVTAGERLANSERLATVVVTHRRQGRLETLSIPATTFRLLTDPGQVRSTWWTKTTPVQGGVVIQGKGYGHGVGLSQIGAWQRAKDGASAADICAAYYVGAVLRRAY